MFRMTAYVDADHVHNQVTIRSMTRSLVMLQKLVENSTYGSDLIESRIAIEISFEIRYMLQSLGLALSSAAFMSGDRKPVILDIS
jgi:hypothetical protein